MKNRYMTDEEKEFIFKNAHQLTRAELAEKLGRSYTTIMDFVNRNKIHCKQGKNKSYNNPYQLTEREMEILELIFQGLSNREIMDKLIISLNTVKCHINSIFGKLGIIEDRAGGSEMRVKAVLKWLKYKQEGLTDEC